MEPVRIIYHPAPGPKSDGSIAEVPPVNLGTDRGFALTWIRRRLGLAGRVDEKLLRFHSEVVPLAVTTKPEEAAALPSSIDEQADDFEASITMPDLLEQQRAEIAAGLAVSWNENRSAIPDLSDDWNEEKS